MKSSKLILRSACGVYIRRYAVSFLQMLYYNVRDGCAKCLAADVRTVPGFANCTYTQFDPYNRGLEMHICTVLINVFDVSLANNINVYIQCIKPFQSCI